MAPVSSTSTETASPRSLSRSTRTDRNESPVSPAASRMSSCTLPGGIPAWSATERGACRLAGPVRLLPTPLTAATDARIFRRLGAPVYGFGLLSGKLPALDYWSRFHGREGMSGST